MITVRRRPRNCTVIVMVMASLVGVGYSSESTAALRVLFSFDGVTPNGDTIYRVIQYSGLSDDSGVAVSVELNGPFGSPEYGLVVYKALPTDLVEIARQNQIVAATGNSIQSFAFNVPVMEPDGNVFLTADLHPPPPGRTRDAGIFKSFGGPLELSARIGDVPVGATSALTAPGLAMVNRAGQFIFVDRGPENTSSVVLGDQDGLSSVLRTGMLLPNGIDSFGPEIIRIGFNEQGNMLLHNHFKLGSGAGFVGRGLFLAGASGVVEIARANQLLLDIGTINHFPVTTGGGSVAAANNNDDVVFSVSLKNNPGGAATDFAVMRYSNGQLTKVFQQGDLAPGGNGRVDLAHGSFADAAGNFYIDVSTTGSSLGAADDFIKLIYSPSGHQIVLREGDAAPAEAGYFASPNHGVVNSQGQWAFLSLLSNSRGGAIDGSGVFLYDMGAVRQIAHVGQPVGDSAIEYFYHEAAFSINDRGEVAILARLSNGSDTILLWSPVPEPAALSLFMAIAICAILCRRRRLCFKFLHVIRDIQA